MKKWLFIIILSIATAGIGFYFIYAPWLNALKTVKAKAVTFTIIIQPFTDISNERAEYVFKEIKKIYPQVILKQAIPLPATTWYPPRARYRADSIINWLSKNTPEGCTVIGLTARDISTTKDEYADWGVMGLGFQPGNACVVSIFRLDKKNLDNQLFKVAIHELGHNMGLGHCEIKSCFMRDAEGHNSTDEETEFCGKCRRKLLAKGWRI